jgi:hypothetical protein
MVFEKGNKLRKGIIPKSAFKKGNTFGKANKGKKIWNKDLKGESYSEHYKNGFGGYKNKGKNIGEKNHSWIDGRSKVKGPARYGDDWDNVRYLIYNRDKFTCQDCKKTGIKMDVHHIIPFMETFDNSLNNLITLCRSCHMKREGNILKLKTMKGGYKTNGR